MSVPVPLAVASDMALSSAFSSQRLVNMYPETSQLGGKSAFMLVRTPGLLVNTVVGDGPFRGVVKMVGAAYFVSGDYLYNLASDGVVTNLGYVDGTGIVSMATAGTQIAIATSNEKGYIYDTSFGVGGTVTEITDPDFFGATSVAALDGYFIWGSRSAYVNRFQISAIYNGQSYDALDFASVETTATSLTRVFTVGSQLFMMKPDRTEIWYNSGNSDFPIEPLNGTVIPKGLAAKFSPAIADNTLFWVGYDEDGGGSPAVFKAVGYTATVVSNHAVSRALSGVSDMSQVVGISYVMDNHTYYGLLLPEGNAWFLDAASGIWHERATYNHVRWLGGFHIDVYGRTLITSYLDGAIYELDPDTHMDAGTLPIVWEATLPPFGTDSDLKCCSRLRLDMDTGEATVTGQGSDPIVNLNISDDRGKTWTSDIPASMGVTGDYGLGVEWTQLGQFRSRVHKFHGSEPIKTVLVAAFADID